MNFVVIDMLVKNTKGFTLIEMLLYTVIAGSLLLAITFFLSLLIQARVKNQTMNQIDQQGLQAMQIISQEIRNAKSISAPLSGVVGQELQLTNFSDQVVIFSVVSGTIIMSENGEVFDLLSASIGVKDLTFTNLADSNNKAIKIQFDLETFNSSTRSEYSYDQTFYETAVARQ